MKAQPWQMDISAYDFQFPLSPLYSHLDTQRHVNNVAVQSFYTEARTRFHIQALGEQSWFSDTVLLRPRRTVTSFIYETHYLADVQCAVRLVAIDARQYRLAMALFQHGRCVGVQECLVGAWQDNQWVALDKGLVDRLEPHLAPGVSLAGLSELAADEAQLQAFPSKAKVVPRFADLDPDQRLGELAVARYLEQSRAGTLNSLRLPGLGLLVARIDIRYDRWFKGMGEVRLPSAVASIGNSSFVVRSGTLVKNELVAASESVMVVVDTTARKSTPIPPDLRQGLEGLMVG